MIPAPFEYERAGSVDEAIALLDQNEDAKILAGGHSLLPLMRLRLASPSMLVDITRIGELKYIREDGDRIAIGALTESFCGLSCCTGGKAASFCSGSAGFAAASGALLAMPFRNTSSTIWSK